MKNRYFSGRKTGWKTACLLAPFIIFINCNNVFRDLPFVDNSPPSDPDVFTAESGNGRVVLTWINPNEPDFTGIKIVRKTDTSPASPTGNTVYTGTDIRYVDINVTNGSIYYYTIFSYDDKMNYSTGVRANGTPSETADTTAPGEVTDLRAEYNDATGVIHFTWTNPADPDFSGVSIVKKMNSEPDSNNDGQQIFSATTYADDEPGAYHYYYRVFTYDTSDNYSAGINAAILYKSPCKIPYLNLNCCDNCK